MKNVFRVSEVESFRQWRDDEEADEDFILRRLRGLDTPTEVMLAGTAFHKALEGAQVGETEVLEVDDYEFVIQTEIEVALPAIRELRASRVYMVDGEPITISGQLDAIEGARVIDHKTTGRFDAERYLTGYQWRLYLEIFGGMEFLWNVFEIAADRDDPRVWNVRDFHQLRTYRYPAMASDCDSLVADFARFVRDYVPERCGAVVAA